MSHPQEPHRQFFPFGNPFRMISPKGSRLSSRDLYLLNKFEETLAERLRKLMPKSKDDVLSFSWMKLAMESLCESHNDIKTLIADLGLPVCDWDEKWIDFYLDNSVKLLDVCVAFSSELTRLNQSKLVLQCLLHHLESDPAKQFIKARSSLVSWRNHIGLKNPRVENCFPILESLVETLDLPKVKNSAKGKVLMCAMFGVKVATIFVFRVSAAAFSGSGKKLSDLSVPDTLPWAHAFSVLQATINGEMKNKFSSEKATVLREVDEVNESLKKLDPIIIQDGVPVDPAKAETFRSLVTDLGSRAEKLSQALGLLGKDVDGFYKIVLTSRDTLLCNLRTDVNIPDKMSGKSRELRASYLMND